MSQVSLRKVGSSFVTTIPAELVQELQLQEGQKFEIAIENGRLVLVPVGAEMDEVLQAHRAILQKYRSAFQQMKDA
ncbi:AbrB/MazE/SpoVT family DNA-binding domain-containing protein [Parachitinimonas caeni]|uniref:AbrB/MazE/SpoVT family DNA-binding domain-containing protein n=1 Tax=Parachitinimonas caeni TaxID=3031301 RepID=A0ABT7DTP8_9NEIS|nr:AbrB/MazE/SpoVT family DNA-binding domain-containing protein [Parachitinimonas caeni]MDK2123456.1 AbrB/MazE/SpoVT family DNA-binding domain-containing protein [Parachitinimonas caeni]